MDWPEPDGYVVKNVRGAAKSALMCPESALPFPWVSRYGSITFDMPADIPGVGGLHGPGCGLNEAGLYVGVGSLFVDSATYPGAGDKQALRCGEVVRVLPDTCATVPEALAKLDTFGVTELFVGNISYGLYWFLADREGTCAIVEFPPGTNGIESVRVPPLHRAMTNDYCEQSYAILSQYEGFGGDKPVSSDTAKRTSDIRFVRNCCLLQGRRGEGHRRRGRRILCHGEGRADRGNHGFLLPDGVDHRLRAEEFQAFLDCHRKRFPEERRSESCRLQPLHGATVLSVDIQSQGSGDVSAVLQEENEGSCGGCSVGTSLSGSALLLPLFLLALTGLYRQGTRQ